VCRRDGRVKPAMTLRAAASRYVQAWSYRHRSISACTGQLLFHRLVSRPNDRSGYHRFAASASPARISDSDARKSVAMSEPVRTVNWNERQGSEPAHSGAAVPLPANVSRLCGRSKVRVES